MNSNEITEMLAAHSLWFASGGTFGECANLVEVDLQNADLASANLQNADLANANLRGANLANADLRDADLRGANLRDANLRNANLRGANLANANLRGADLRDADLARAIFDSADLRGADLAGALLARTDLRDADLRYADLDGANLEGANLEGANLEGANLEGANLEGANLPQNWQIVPRVGQSFTAFKKVRGEIVLEFLIPGSAQRTSSLIGRKCRANEALVVGVAYGDANNAGIYESLYDLSFTYEIGKMAFEPSFDPDIRIECTAGIHFFLTKEEAIDYR